MHAKSQHDPTTELTADQNLILGTKMKQLSLKPGAYVDCSLQATNPHSNLQFNGHWEHVDSLMQLLH